MENFFQSKRNRIIVAIVAAVLVLATAVIVTVVLTRKKNAELPEKITQSTEAQTEVQTTTEPQTEASTETSAPETTETSTKPAAKKDTNSTKPNSKGSSDGKSDSSGNKNSPVIDFSPIRLVGRWGISETIQPSELFSAEFIEITGFNKALKVATTYQFNNNNTFTITYEVHWDSSYESALRDAYTIYFREIYPDWTDEEVEYRASQTASRQHWEICAAIIGIESDAGQIGGTYTCDDTTIYYKTSDGTSFSETYILQEKSLKLTGSSEGNEGYPITLSRWN